MKNNILESVYSGNCMGVQSKRIVEIIVRSESTVRYSEYMSRLVSILEIRHYVVNTVLVLVR